MTSIGGISEMSNNKANSLGQFLFINGKQLESDTYSDLFSPYSGEKIAEIAFCFIYCTDFSGSRFPYAVLNVVTGSGSVVGETIIRDERVGMITFTGSPAVGIGIRNKVGLKKTTLELGSNAAVIVDQGVEINKIIDRLITGAFSNQGQLCISLQRTYAHEDLFDELVDKLAVAAKFLRIGVPLDPETYISALISKKDTERALSWIQEAEQKGATVVMGGRTQQGILEPTILTNVDPHLSVSCQEIFAPVVNVC